MSNNKKRVTKRNQNNLKAIIIVVSAVLIALIIALGLTKYFKMQDEKKLEVETEISSEEFDELVTIEKEESENALFFTKIEKPIFEEKSDLNEQLDTWISSYHSSFNDEVENLNYKKLKEKTSFYINLIDKSKLDDNHYLFTFMHEELIKDDSKLNLKTFFVDSEEEKIIPFKELFNIDELVDNKKFKEEIEIDKEQLEDEDLAYSITDEKLTFYSIEKAELKEQSIELIHIYPFIALNYDEVILSQDVKDKIAAIKKEEERKRQEEEEKKRQEEQEKEENENTAEETDKKMIALTFDDGPDPNVTERILETLSQYNAKATFFMLGKNAQAYSNVAKKVADAGHEIANHTIEHPDLVTLSIEGIQNQLVQSQNQIEEATGKRPIYFRPPYGSYNDNVLNIAKESNQKVIMWSVDTRDWESKNPAAINQIVQTYARPGSIILMHDIHSTTADALPQVLEFLSNQGYEFVTVSELLPYIEGSGVGPYNGN